MSFALESEDEPRRNSMPLPRAQDHDDVFTSPYIDVDESREHPALHRYIHGGFTGTNTRFSLYFPPEDLYEGRFFQHITPTPESENLGPTRAGAFSKIAFAFASGAYFVETNGGGHEAGPSIAGFRANAAAAQYSREVAGMVYGEHRPFGYAYGGSGGAFRVIGGVENTTGVWDGVVPYVPGSPLSIPNVFSVRMHAMRVLRDRFVDIVDAIEPGGSGDPYALLDEHESAALREATRMGFPLRSWFGHRTMGMHAFSVLYPAVRAMDSDYFDDFWTQPGYLGACNDASIHADRVVHPTRLVETILGAQMAERGLEPPRHQAGGVDDSYLGSGSLASTPVAVRLSDAPQGYVLGADLLVESGTSAGARLGVLTIVEDIVMLGANDPAAVIGLAAGDRVVVDNSGFLAAQTYHRHQVPGQEFAVWDQFRDAAGEPLYPQRPMLLGPSFAAGAAGSVQSGRFDGRMIMVSALLDREALPWQADWYSRRVEEHLGDAATGRYRLWFVDNAIHGDYDEEEDPLRTVSYVGVVHQAMRDLAAWVETGREPLASSTYEVVDGQIMQPANASDRGGLQAVLDLRANGAARADVLLGETVTVTLDVEVPPGAGTVVAVEWDEDGRGNFTRDDTPLGSRTARSRTVRFEHPGTHFVGVRVTTQRDSNFDDVFTRILNVARVRIVVSD